MKFKERKRGRDEERRWLQQQLGGGVLEGGEAAAAVAVAAGEAFGSDNGKHSFRLRVSVHQCRGPGEKDGGGLCELTANTHAFSW